MVETFQAYQSNEDQRWFMRFLGHFLPIHTIFRTLERGNKKRHTECIQFSRHQSGHVHLLAFPTPAQGRPSILSFLLSISRCEI